MGFRSNVAYLEILLDLVLHLRSIGTDDCGEIKFGMFLASMMAIGFIRLDWNDIIM